MNEFTLRKQFETVLLAEIKELNGDITEEGLNMAIMESILEDRVKAAQLDREQLVEERLTSEEDTGKVEKNGVYVYNAYGELGLQFDRYNTIADAVREALKTISSTILCDGEIIEYDVLDSETAYYIDNRIGKVMLVNI